MYIYIYIYIYIYTLSTIIYLFLAVDIAILYYIHFNLYYIYTILFYIYVCFRFGSPLHELSLSEATAMAPGPAGILMLLEC